MNQFILIVNGPIRSGKTKVIEIISASYKKVFLLSANKLKFLISDYSPDRDRKLVHEAVMQVAETMLKGGMSLVMEGGSMAQGNLNHGLAELAKKYNLKVTIVNIEAPLDVLKKRFAERLVLAKERGSKLSVTDDAGYMQRYDAYQRIKGEAEKTFDSSKLSPEEIAKGIMELI